MKLTGALIISLIFTANLHAAEMIDISIGGDKEYCETVPLVEWPASSGARRVESTATYLYIKEENTSYCSVKINTEVFEKQFDYCLLKGIDSSLPSSFQTCDFHKSLIEHAYVFTAAFKKGSRGLCSFTCFSGTGFKRVDPVPKESKSIKNR